MKKKVDKRPVSKIIENQIQQQLKEKGYRNQFGEIIGKWPGDEKYEDLIQDLNR